MLSGTFAHCAGVRMAFASLIPCVASFLPSAIDGCSFPKIVIGSGLLTVVSPRMLATLSTSESALTLNASRHSRFECFGVHPPAARTAPDRIVELLARGIGAEGEPALDRDLERNAERVARSVGHACERVHRDHRNGEPSVEAERGRPDDRAQEEVTTSIVAPTPFGDVGIPSGRSGRSAKLVTRPTARLLDDFRLALLGLYGQGRCP